MKRKTTWLVLTAAAIALGSGVFSMASAEENEPCKIATKGESPVAKACAAGGRAQAQKVMKSAVKAAKAKGVVFKCDGCHEDMDAYQLKDNARDDFKKLMAAATKK